MGIKRLGKKNLFTTEKKGQEIVPTIGSGMKDALISATQHREGNKLVTDLVFDLGTSKATIKSGGATANLPLGKEGATSSDTSQLCKITDSVFGIVTNLEVVCLEAASDGNMTDYNLLAGADGDGYLTSADTSAAVITGSGALTADDILSTVGDHTVIPIDDNGLSDQFLYLACGATAGTANASASAEIVVGSDFNVNQITNDMTAIILESTDGTSLVVNFDSGTAHGSTTPGGADVGYDGLTTESGSLATAIKVAISGSSSGRFDASVDGTTVTVTQVEAGVGGNTSITLVQGTGSLDITIDSAFSGGQTKGTSTAMSSGKFLLRTTGFVAPDDAS